MPRARDEMDSQKAGCSPVCVRPSSAKQRAAWEAAAADAGETVSDLVRHSVEVELRRREEAQPVEVERLDPFGLRVLLERVRQ